MASRTNSPRLSTNGRHPTTEDRGSVQLSISEQLLGRNVKQFRGGLVLKAHRLVYRSTLGLRVIKKKREEDRGTREREQVVNLSRLLLLTSALLLKLTEVPLLL